MDETARNKLWEEYSKTRRSDLREKLILEYSQLVKLVAGRLSMYLGYNVEFDDLVGYGIFGLIDAIDKFDYGKNVKFETYASLRIRGEILDQIRKMDWIPRSLRQKQKKIDAAMAKIEAEAGRPAKDEEIAKELGITEDELIAWQGQSNVTNLISLDEFTEAGSDVKMDATSNSHFEQPETAMEKQELKEKMAQALDSLTEKERNVIVLYYYEEMTLKEISLTLDVTVSRVSQLHTKALQKMKGQLGDYIGILFS
ncbi:MAG: FliA/WhiG family RNA polymerase sigma factor [Lachnospiraceae bacterium]